MIIQGIKDIRKGFEFEKEVWIEIKVKKQV